MTTDIVKLQSEINTQIANKEVFNALANITFKGLEPQLIKRAMLEGCLRGFTFQDFLQKNVYAIPFKGGYSLVTSIDYSRKIGMRSGVCGKSEPIFEEKDGQIISCAVTIKRSVSGIVGEYTAKVYFNEYTTGRNLWVNKPRTMIAKVAEMHALRSACPEELSQTYIEEEMAKETEIETLEDNILEEIKAIETVEELNSYYDKNKGRGKLFDEQIANKMKELNAKQTDNS
jgi:hypothetical protein